MHLFGHSKIVGNLITGKNECKQPSVLSLNLILKQTLKKKLTNGQYEAVSPNINLHCSFGV
jgi:hypothetical protein